MIIGVLFGVVIMIITSIANYIRFSEKAELFDAKEEAQAQTAQLKTILNELDNGILIFQKLFDSEFRAKYINNKINLLFGVTDVSEMTDRTEEYQQCLDS